MQLGLYTVFVNDFVILNPQSTINHNRSLPGLGNYAGAK